MTLMDSVTKEKKKDVHVGGWPETKDFVEVALSNTYILIMKSTHHASMDGKSRIIPIDK